MVVGLPISAYRSGYQTTFLMLLERFDSVKREKKRLFFKESGVNKRDERKRTYRRSVEKSVLTVKIETFRCLREEYSGYLFTGYMAVVVEKA